MNRNSFFTWRTKKILFFLLVVCILGVVFFSHSFASKTTPPANKLEYGAYTNWIKNALEHPPASGEEKLLHYNTVKQSNALATKQGEKVIWVVDGKIGVGIKTPQEIFDIRSQNKASVKISSSTNEAKVILGDGKFSLLGSDFFLQMGSQKIFITESGINVEGQVTIKDKNVVLGDQHCPSGQAILGTDEEGKILCTDNVTIVRYCNVNDLNMSFPIRLVGRCQLAPQKLASGCLLDLSGNQVVDDNCALQ